MQRTKKRIFPAGRSVRGQQGEQSKINSSEQKSFLLLNQVPTQYSTGFFNKNINIGGPGIHHIICIMH